MSTGRERKPKSGGSPTSSAMHRILAKHHKRRYSAKSDANKAGKSRHRRGRDYSSPVSLMLPDSSSMSDIDSLSSTSSSCSDSESETDVPRSVTIRQNMPENSAVKKRIAKSGTSEQRTGARTSIVTASPLTKGIQGRFPHPITIPSSAVSQNSPVSEAANPMSFPPTPTTTPPDGHLLSLRKTGYWTGDETHRLINAVTAHGQAWGRVARDVQTRDSNQCEKRWRRIDPNDFTPKKDEENVRRADYGWVDWDKTRATSVTSPSSVQSNIRLPSPYRGPVEPIPRDPRSRIIFGDQSSSGTGDEEHDDDDDEDESDDDGGQNRKTSIRLPSAALVAPVISGIPPSTDDAAQYYYSLSVAPTTSRPRLAPKPPTPRVLPAPVIAPSPPTAVANTIGAFSATSPAVSATSTKAGVPPSEIHIAPSVTISVRGRTPHSQPSQRTIRPWTPSEDACLLHAVSIHSNNWRLVASMVPTRNTRQCKEHYLRVLARRSDVAGNAVPRGGVAKMGRGDESHPPTSRTSATSPSMAQPRSRTPPAKSAKMSAPSSGSTKPKTRTRRPPWTPAEDTRLQQAYDEMGPRWAVMVAEGLVGHRTEEECRGRMRVLKARATGGGSGAAKTSKRAAAGTGEMDEEHPSADQSAPESAQEDDDDDVDDDDDDDDDTGAASEV
ncbi:hypothetical protein DFS34DRAFT_623245 [Phlyctochytrium arcticum]|nr:hypothetical protein DFS34DRAFT_623245 [Phlyctochytrium arcticum]